MVLTQVSNGRLDLANTVATVTLEANDDPYGSFAFAPSSQPLRVVEGSGVAMVTIIREFGITGSVEVSFRTLASSTLPGELRSRAVRYVCAPHCMYTYVYICGDMQHASNSVCCTQCGCSNLHLITSNVQIKDWCE